MNVIVPVAGLGTRLRPHTWSRPKPLVSVAGKPVLGHVLDRLIELPLDRVVFVTGYLGEQIEQYVRKHYDFDAAFVTQREQRGQSDAVLRAKGVVSGPTLVVFPDMLFEADLEQLLRIDADGALFVKEVSDPRRFGVVVIEDGRIARLVEKPREPVSNLAVVGLYYLREIHDLFDAIDWQIANDVQHGGEFYLADALQHLIDQGKCFTWLTVDVWEDCGNPEALLQTNRYLLERGANVAPPLDGSVIVPPVVIDPSATIRNSVIGPFASIGAKVMIANSIVADSIVDEGAQIETAMLTRSIVGRHAFVRGDFMRVNVGDSSDIVLAGHGDNGQGGRG
ncbi:MAG: NTP transferase domain-containing protein [Thermomicrobiaceae bacterium]|nr:NTP transferase domain-containing protein [Thermomicrobiaceae bacterium]